MAMKHILKNKTNWGHMGALCEGK